MKTFLFLFFQQERTWKTQIHFWAQKCIESGSRKFSSGDEKIICDQASNCSWRPWVYFWECTHLKKYERCTGHVMTKTPLRLTRAEWRRENYLWLRLLSCTQEAGCRSGIILVSSNQDFHDPSSSVFSAEKTRLRFSTPARNCPKNIFLLKNFLGTPRTAVLRSCAWVPPQAHPELSLGHCGHKLLSIIFRFTQILLSTRDPASPSFQVFTTCSGRHQRKKSTIKVLFLNARWCPRRGSNPHGHKATKF